MAVPTPPKDVEKSIDSLQRIHALVSALALGEAVRRLLLKPGTAEPVFNLGNLPTFIALVCTIVPFYHGMHRHLEATYLFGGARRPPKGALLIDFVFFLLEAGVFFALATLLASISFFWLLAALLALDATWSGLTAMITQAQKARWCLLNFITAIVMVVVLSLNVFLPGMDAWLLALTAVVRAVVDYYTHWDFYFPFGDEPPIAAAAAAPAAEPPVVGAAVPPEAAVEAGAAVPDAVADAAAGEDGHAP